MATEDDVTTTEAERKRKFNAVSPAGVEHEDDFSATSSKDSPMGNQLVDGKGASPPASEMEEKAKGDGPSACDLLTLKNSKINISTTSLQLAVLNKISIPV